MIKSTKLKISWPKLNQVKEDRMKRNQAKIQMRKNNHLEWKRIRELIQLAQMTLIIYFIILIQNLDKLDLKIRLWVFMCLIVCRLRWILKKLEAHHLWPIPLWNQQWNHLVVHQENSKKCLRQNRLKWHHQSK